MSAHFGLDIGSTSIKITQLDGKKLRAIAIGANSSGKPISEMTNSEKIVVTDQIKVLLKDSGVKATKVVASISESAVYSRVMKFPVMSTPELSTAIKWELDQSVPFPPHEIETSWSILEKPERFSNGEEISVYVVAVPTKISEVYVQICELLGLEVERLENEIPALIRSFSPTLSNEQGSVIIDFGSRGTNMIVTGQGKIYGNFYVPIGGLVLTRMVAEAFGLSIDQAENYKRTYGLAKDQVEGKVAAVIAPAMDNIISELKKMIISYKNEMSDREIGKIVLCGGGSYLMGLVPYLSQSVDGIEVVLGDVFGSVQVEERYRSLGPVFAVANGLAIQE